MAQHLNFPNVLQNYQNLYDNQEKTQLMLPNRIPPRDEGQ